MCAINRRQPELANIALEVGRGVRGFAFEVKVLSQDGCLEGQRKEAEGKLDDLSFPMVNAEPLFREQPVPVT